LGLKRRNQVFIPFGKEGRLIMRQRFPDNPIFVALGDLSKKTRTLADLKHMRSKAEGNILRYGYKLLALLLEDLRLQNQRSIILPKEPQPEVFLVYQKKLRP
jgi:hypothetical protein